MQKIQSFRKKKFKFPISYSAKFARDSNQIPFLTPKKFIKGMQRGKKCFNHLSSINSHNILYNH